MSNTFTHLICRRVTPKDNRVTTLDTLWTRPSDTVARNSSAHAHVRLHMLTVPNSETEILSILKIPWNVQGNGCHRQ